jgi:hypothetical protein
VVFVALALSILLLTSVSLDDSSVRLNPLLSALSSHLHHLHTMEQFPTAIAIETLFRDAYKILEEVHGAVDHMEAVSGALTNCHRSIQMLERIHREQVRSQNPDISQDIFGLRQKLDRFVASCNALNYLAQLSSHSVQVGCMGTGSKPARKKKQERELQEEFWDHQRLLSLALANAIL